MQNPSLNNSLAAQLRVQHLLQPADNLLADLRGFLGAEGVIGSLVGQAIGQAFLARADLLATEDVEQAHIHQRAAACPGE